MKTIDVTTFRQVYARTRALLMEAPLVKTGTWQSLPADKPEMATYEVEDVVINFPIPSEDLVVLRQQIGPNHPWANDHFELDRVSGEPLNPGHTWAQWPYANKANSFRDEDGQFNHTYAERYWSKFANLTPDGSLTPEQIADATSDKLELRPTLNDPFPRRGIRYEYGDLNDVLDLLQRDPMTRAAYLPIFFPEDTGIVHRDRVPCTLGYLFRQRNSRLSVAYYIRSCDFVRHFRDDVYLTARLLLWVLDRLRTRDEAWSSVRPGDLLMHVGSMHMFVNDRRVVEKEMGS